MESLFLQFYLSVRNPGLFLFLFLIRTRHNGTLKTRPDRYLDIRVKTVISSWARTRANSRELGRTPREFAGSSPTPTLRRTRGERWLRFLPANEFSGEPFASSRRSTRELGRTRANSAELRRTFGVLRRTFGGVRRSVGVGELLANSRGVRAEFARVRASSRRTIVRRVYSRDLTCEERSVKFKSR